VIELLNDIFSLWRVEGPARPTVFHGGTGRLLLAIESCEGNATPSIGRCNPNPYAKFLTTSNRPSLVTVSGSSRRLFLDIDDQLSLTMFLSQASVFPLQTRDFLRRRFLSVVFSDDDKVDCGNSFHQRFMAPE
jgi:hypothetical protein